MPADAPAVSSGDASGLAWGEPRARWVLAATVLGSGLAFIDGTVVNVALPRIGDSLGAGVSGLQWTINAYTLTLASLILLGGSLGDRFGRRRVFVIGVVWFAVASLGCGIAPNIETLVAARAVQGVGGALLTPGSLAILQSTFRPQDRVRAIGAWSGLGGIAGAAGPFLGGYLVESVGWRWVFLINLPFAVAVVLIATRHVPESRDPQASQSLDVVGAAVGAVGLGGADVRPDLVAGAWTRVNGGAGDPRRGTAGAGRVRVARALCAGADAAAGHLHLGRVQRHQHRHLRGVRRAERVVPVPGTDPPDRVRLLADRCRRRPAAGDGADAAALLADGCAVYPDRPADPHDRRPAGGRGRHLVAVRPRRDSDLRRRRPAAGRAVRSRAVHHRRSAHGDGPRGRSGPARRASRAG